MAVAEAPDDVHSTVTPVDRVAAARERVFHAAAELADAVIELDRATDDLIEAAKGGHT